MSLPEILIIGSLNKDLVTRTPRIPSAGETLTATAFDTGSGGKGANQAVACSRLSRYRDVTKPVYANVKMIGAVGEDSFGHDLQSGLNSNSIDTSGVVVRKGEQTGIAVIIVEEENGENRILVLPNANYTLKPKDFDSLPLPLPELIVLQLEIPLDTVLRIIQLAKEKKVEVLLNPAPALELPNEVYRGLSHLVLNETEAAILSKSDEKLDLYQSGRKFLELGVQNIVITLGGRGAFFCSSSDGQISEVIQAEKVKVVDTTAAGDTFVGAYAVKVAQHKGDRTPFDLRSAVSWANEAAKLTVQQEGAQNSIPWLDEISNP